MKKRRSSTSSSGSNREGEDLADIVSRAKTAPHQRIRGADDSIQYVMLTVEHYDAMRRAISACWGFAKMRSPNPKTKSIGEVCDQKVKIDLKRVRELQGWSKATLARESRVPAPTITRLEDEDNESGARLQTVFQLARALKVSIEMLLK